MVDVCRRAVHDDDRRKVVNIVKEMNELKEAISSEERRQNVAEEYLKIMRSSWNAERRNFRSSPRLNEGNFFNFYSMDAMP